MMKGAGKRAMFQSEMCDHRRSIHLKENPVAHFREHQWNTFLTFLLHWDLLLLGKWQNWHKAEMAIWWDPACQAVLSDPRARLPITSPATPRMMFVYAARQGCIKQTQISSTYSTGNKTEPLWLCWCSQKQNQCCVHRIYSFQGHSPACVSLLHSHKIKITKAAKTTHVSTLFTPWVPGPINGSQPG